MASLTEVDLKLVLSATGQQEVESVLKGLQDAVTTLVTTLDDLGRMDPFSKLVADASDFATVMRNASDATDTFANSVNTATDAVARLQDAMVRSMGVNPFAALEQDTTALLASVDKADLAMSTLVDRIDRVGTIPDPYAALQEGAVTLTQDVDGTWKAFGTLDTTISDFRPKDPYTQIMDQTVTFTDDIIKATDSVKLLGSAVSDLKISPDVFTGFEAQLQVLDEKLTMTMDELDNMFAALDQHSLGMMGGTTGGGTSKGSGHGSSLNLMSMGMNAMMGYYGLQTLVSSASNMMYIQQMMQQGMGMTHGNYGTGAVNQAAQAYAMLSASGLTGSAGVSTLTGIQSNLATMFTRTGTGMLSKNALILQQYGIGPQTAAESPWQSLQTIQQSYAKLMGAGRATDASQLLSLTGTSQLATAFQNWSTLKSSTSGVNLGMNSKQLSQAAKQDVKTQSAMAMLSLEFDQLAQAMTPVISSFADMTRALQPVLNLGKDFSNSSVGKLASPLLDLSKYNNFMLNLLSPKGRKSDMQQLSHVMDQLGKSAQFVLKPIQGVATDIQRIFGQLYKSDIAPGLSYMENHISTFASGLWAATRKEWMTLQTNLGTFANGLWNMTKRDWDSLVNGIGKFASSLWKLTLSDWESFAHSLGAWISSLWSDIEVNALSAAHSVPLIGNHLVSNSSMAEARFQNDLYNAGYGPSNLAISGNAKGGNIMNINITGGSLQERQNARVFAQEVIQQLKIQGNFDLSF